MKKYSILLALLITSLLNMYAQKSIQELDKALLQVDLYNDVYFQFPLDEISNINDLPSFISISNVIKKEGIVQAYVHKINFEKLLALNLNFEVISRNNTKDVTVFNMATTTADMATWDRYPTYDVYVQMMQDFAADYPAIARLVTIGTSQGGRDILAIKITDNPDIDEDEPEFFYSGQMHGNELVSSIMLLRLADYLLSNYGSDSQVDNLVNNIEIWINPLANPDGLYRNDDNTVSTASRYFNNGVDPNRNFPSSADEHPDGNAWAVETVAMMDFSDAHDFVLSCNIHSGAEVANYPWDEWESSTREHVDVDWWQLVAYEYANTVYNNSPYGYFTDVTDDGVTEGGDWYVVIGGRQDYMNYFKQCRELTLELSSTQMLSSTELPNHWNYNYNSLLKYMEQSLYGIRGIITDAQTGDPIKAKVEIVGYDDDVSFVYSSLPIGNYHRLIKTGTYDVTYSKDGYISQTISVNTTDYQTTVQDVALVPDSLDVSELPLKDLIEIIPNPTVDNKLTIRFGTTISNIRLNVFDVLGKNILNVEKHQILSGNSLVIDMSNFEKGLYYLTMVTKQGKSITKKVILN